MRKAGERYSRLLRDYVARGEEGDLAAIREVGAAMAGECYTALEVVELHAGAMSSLCEHPPEVDGTVVFARLSEAQADLVGAFDRVRHGVSIPLPSAWATAAGNSMVERLLTALSHELRTPLTTILTWSELGGAGALEPGSTKAAMQLIERSARRLIRTIDDVAVASRIYNGDLGIGAGCLDLRDVAERVYAANFGAAELRGIELTVQLPGAEVAVLGDSRCLEQAIGNLVANAIKFTPGGGRVEVRLEEEATIGRVVVRDSGSGIAPNALARIFEEPGNADVHQVRRRPGLGLGLPVVRFLVESHGGRLLAESAGLGRGSSFSVELPLRPDANLSDDSLRSAYQLAGLRVLVVDPDVDVRQAIALGLRRWGVKVEAVERAAAALTLLEEFDPEILLIETSSSRSEGLALITTVRQRECGSDVRLPALACGDVAGNEAQEAAIRAGFDGLIGRPFEATELAESLVALDPRVAAASPDGLFD